MKIVKGTQIFFGSIGLIIAIIAITIIWYSDRSVVTATSPGSITMLEIETGEVKTKPNWWNNNNIKVNDIMNGFQFVIGQNSPKPQSLHLEIYEDVMIARTTKPQG